MKRGLVLEGGAMRGLFTAGVLDVLMGRGVTFDGIVGVSAGACFWCNYKSGQIGRVIREEVDALYIEGTRYRKTGIVFFGLEKPGTAHQTDLFDDTPPAEKSRLYAAVDALNARYGKGKVFSAAQGLGTRSWHMKRQKLSRRPTTRWDELMTVR